MKFFCDNCNAQYMIADEKVGTRGVKVKCKKCAHVIVVKPASDAASASADADSGGDQNPGGADAASQVSPEKSEADLSGAFDSLISESPAGLPAEHTSLTAVSGDPGETSIPTSPSPAVGDKVWYVAVEDRQVGPIDIQELTKLWQEGRVKDETLGWRAGMPDWVALVEIPELQVISNSMGPRTAKAESAEAPAASTASPKPATVEWKPSAASALSSLVQEELLASATPKDEIAKPPTGVPDLGFSGYASGDLFGGQVQSPPPPGAEAAGAAPQWAVPQAKQKSKGLVYVFGGIAAGVVVMAAIMVTMVMRSRNSAAPPPRSTTVAAPAPSAAAPSAAAPTAASPPGAAAPSAPANNAPAPAPTVAPAKEPAAERDEDERSPKRRGKRSNRSERNRERGEGRPAAVAAADPGSASKANLTADDVRGGVHQYASKAVPCLRAARSRNEIGPGTYTFTLDWVIQPDGSVRQAELKGPAAVLDSSLPACFQAVLSQWRFPASQNGAPVRNFPFGPVNIP